MTPFLRGFALLGFTFATGCGATGYLASSCWLFFGTCCLLIAANVVEAEGS